MHVVPYRELPFLVLKTSNAESFPSYDGQYSNDREGLSSSEE